MTREEQLVLTAVWRNGGCSTSYDSFVGSTAVLRLNFRAKNPPLCQAQNDATIRHRIKIRKPNTKSSVGF